MHSLRIDGESDEEFRRRAERAGRIAHVLVEAALENHCIEEFIRAVDIPYTVETVRQSPTVRVEYEQAIAIGDVGSCLAATRSKRWGDGPYIMPLERHDPVDPYRTIYVFRPNSVYNRRFHQRQRMKELLGKRYRPLVERAKSKYSTKSLFLERLTEDEAVAIRRVFGIDPGEFWRAAKGRIFLELPPRLIQLELEFPSE